MTIEHIEQRRRVETGLKTNIELLSYYATPENDHMLTEEDTVLIEELWCRVYNPGHKGPRYYRFEDEEAGETHPITPEDKTRPVNVIEEGFWYAPVRQTFEEIHGEGEIRTSIEGIKIARTPQEAIREAKKMAFIAGFSDTRNCLKTEVLLSGQLKFDRQLQPKWIDVRLITEKEEAELRETHRSIMEELGYKAH